MVLVRLRRLIEFRTYAGVLLVKTPDFIPMDVPRLHPETMEAVNQRVDIAEIVSEYVVLKKQGKDYLGLCPFHAENSPSFSVSPSKQLYYCFGCQAGGNGVKFLMEVGKRSFSEVVLDLAQRYQIPIKTLEPKQREELQRQLSLREQLYEVLAIASSFFQHALRQPQGEFALNYLKTKRQLKEETIQIFRLGYAPSTWDTLYRYLVEQKKIAVALVNQAGLISPKKSGDGYVDRFRDRLIIPIADSQGRVIGFGGRTLSEEQPKYLNSPDTELFNKGKTLFALDQAKSAIAKQDQAVVVEGYFDAIALHSAGIKQTVASLGTALTGDQVRSLLRYTESKQIILNFDADRAGVNAASKAIGSIAPLIYSGQVGLRVVTLPDGKDADEFLLHNPVAKYQELLTNAPLWIDWQLQQLLVGTDLKQADQFQQINNEMVKILKEITENNQRTHYLQQCASLLSQGDGKLFPLLLENLLTQIGGKRSTSLISPQTKLAQEIAKTAAQSSSKTSILTTSSDQSLLEKSETLLMRLYLHCPEYREVIITVLEERDLVFTIAEYRFLWQQIVAIEPTLSTQQPDLIAKLQDEYLQFPEKLNQISHLFHLNEFTENQISVALELINAAVACMERVICEKCCRYYLDLWKKTSVGSDLSLAQQYWRELSISKQRIKELDGELQFLYFHR